MTPKPPALVTRIAGRSGRGALVSVASWLFARGQELWKQNLTPAEREEFRFLIMGSKGRRRNLTDAETARLMKLVIKVLVGPDGPDPSDLRSIAEALRRS